ncbi:hypothetical protein G6F56_005565 [Rhizopus delemar]|nr:hypothetical protein G6F56_005565 [Rhizopus delemar]
MKTTELPKSIQFYQQYLKTYWLQWQINQLNLSRWRKLTTTIKAIVLDSLNFMAMKEKTLDTFKNFWNPILYLATPILIHDTAAHDPTKILLNSVGIK